KGKYIQLIILLILIALLFLLYNNYTLSNFFYFGIDLQFYHFYFSLLLFSISVFVYLFSFYYIKENLKEFYLLFSSFITSMFFFIVSPSLIQLLVFWELMTVISFLLIDFYKDKESYFSSIKAYSFTYVGDLALLIFVSYFIAKGIFLISEISYIPLLIQIILIIAVISKGAQFPFTGWLTDAMIAPTPVSALLHSATMVVAGAFLLIIFSKLLTIFPIVLVIVYLNIAITSFLAAFESNIKKINAYYTSSTISTIIITSLINPFLSFLYLINHAFYKVSLFVIAGKEKLKYNELDIYKLRQKTYSLGEIIAIFINSLFLADFIPSVGYSIHSIYFNSIYWIPLDFIVTFSAFKFLFTRFHKRKGSFDKFDILAILLIIFSFSVYPFIKFEINYSIIVQILALVLAFFLFYLRNVKLSKTLEIYRFIANKINVNFFGKALELITKSKSYLQMYYSDFSYKIDNSLSKYLVYLTVTIITVLLLSIIV
ncbi:MAG: proton-conducting transporter membrane subunit, partial [Candidatus Rehaiarchaeum fermentans]|nr:proton-conducting transporter membrane subunit [Candidatus Rehaiarchaeum fermentans]